MATITPTLTITSSDAFSDALSVSFTDDLSALGPCQSKRVTISNAGNYQLSEDDDDKKTYFFVKNIDGAATVTFCLSNGGAAYMALGPGEWAFFPWGAASTDLFLDSSASTSVVEIMSFQATT